jgi:sigma-E factor negative regulatory protein RseA
MTDPIHEQISAFHDGELSAAESELLLKRFARDAALRAAVGRYALIGEALRSTKAGGPSKDFASRVAKAIEREAAPGISWRPIANWLKPVAGGAIAAGVAAVALVSVRMTTPDTSPEQIAVVAPPSAEAVPSAEVIQAVDRAKSEPPQGITVPMNTSGRNPPPIQVINNGRLANFVMAHSEYSSPLDQRSVLTGLLIEEQQESQESNAQQSAAQRPSPQRLPR